MRFFINLKSSAKSFIGLTTLFALLLVITLMSITAFQHLNNNVVSAVDHVLPSVHLLSEIDRDLQQTLVAERSILLATPGTDEFNGFVSDMETNIEQTEERWQEFRKVFDLTTEDKLIQTYESKRKEWLPITRRIPAILQQQTDTSYQEAMALSYGHAATVFEEMRDAIDVLGQKSWEHAGFVKQRSHEVYSSNHLLLISLLIAGILVWIGLSIFINYTVSKSIKEVISGMSQISDSILNGKLGERVDPSAFVPEFRPIGNGANEIIEAFVRPIKVMQEYIERISTGRIPTPIDETYNGDFDKIKTSLNVCINTLTTLLSDVEHFVVEAEHGRLMTRADASVQQGDYKRLVEGINAVVNTILTMVDSAPCPFMIIDREFNIQFMNKTGADLLQKTQVELVGKKCYNHFKTHDCQTDKCALGKAMKSGTTHRSETKANPVGLDLDISYEGVPIRDRSGDVVGSLEIVMDQTDIMNARRLSDKITRYQEEEVTKLVDRLQDLANGNLEFETTTAETDKDTKDTGSRFMAINQSLDGVKKALGQLTADAQELVQAALDGNLKSRARADKHRGEYKQLVQGINQLLDAIIDPINEAMTVMADLANKNLTARVQGDYMGDLDVFKQNINDAGSNLEDALSQVGRAVQQITAAAGEISNGSQSLAAGSSQQASSLEEIASSLEEMNSITLNNADNSKQGMDLSEQSLLHVRKGNDAMVRMNKAMESIAKSAQETSNIIKTINDIAFQTNLLALNAAVEAAHAGEAGKGFAVVAEEVKNLALRSAEAAKNTDELIETSLKNSEDGAKIVEEVSHSFENIQSSFSKVNNIVKEISVSSDEQAEGIRQINVAVGELNKVTQGNAANAEESASAAEELNSQSAELKTMVEAFQLSNSISKRPVGRRMDDRVKITEVYKSKTLPAPSKNSNKYGNKDMEIILPDEGEANGDF